MTPVISRVKMSKVLIDGGSGLNIIFSSTLDRMKLQNAKMAPANDPFFGFIPGSCHYPVGRITLPVTLRTPESYRTEYLHFEVAGFKSPYNAILGRPALAKFMAILNHTYLVLKMPAPCSMLTVRGDVQMSYTVRRKRSAW